jgi:Family of unknown function (DUF6084)
LPTAPAQPGSIPALAFSVEGVAPLERAAVPTLRFSVGIDAGGDVIRSILLHTQVQIAARLRRYEGAAEEERLYELFGERERWGTTLRTLPWINATQVVPAFTGATTLALDVPCTYDFEVVASRYLAALEGGEVPLELMFAGTVFYAGAGGMLQTARIAWDREAEYRMAVSVWRETMERYFPDTTWLRLRRSSFERLQAYKSRNALTGFDDAIERLLPDPEGK